MLKKKLLFLIPAFAALSLSACTQAEEILSKINSIIENSNSQSVEENSNSNTGNSNSASAPAVKDVTIDFWHTFGQGIEEGMQAYVDQFQKIIKDNEGVNVTINLSKEGSYTDIHTKIVNGLGASNVPTLAVAYPDHVADYLHLKKDAVVNLDSYINDEKIGFGKESYLGDSKGKDVYDKDDFIPVFMDEGRNYAYEGTYSIPFMKSTEIMFYIKNIIRRALKIHKPEIYNNEAKVKEYMNNLTWDELFTLAQVIKNNKSTVAPKLEYPVFYDSDGNLFISQLYQRNIGYSSYDNSHKPQIDFENSTEKAKVVSFLDELRQLHKDGLLTTKDTKGEYSSYSFTPEKCAIAIGSSGGAGYNIPSGDAFELGVAPVPYKGQRKYVTQGVTLAILRNPGYSDAVNDAKCYYAWKFAKFITNPSVNASICIEDSQGYVPVRESAYEIDKFMEFLGMSEDNDYAKTAEVVMEINGGADYYINTPVFSGSANLRNLCGGAIATLLTSDDNNDTVSTESVVNEVIKNAKSHIA